LPEQLRGGFFGDLAKEAYDLFFAATSAALHEKLAGAKGFKAFVNGFMGVLHTWGQQMQFHPHLHYLVPGAGINARGKVIKVKYADYLVKIDLLQGAFREHFRRLYEAKGWQTDPGVWRKNWGVHIKAAGSGAEALKYLGAYVSRSVISDSRIVRCDEATVTFQWKNRDTKRVEQMTLSGMEFVRRYLRHVLPRGLRALRYYGYCHPAALRKRERVRMNTGCVIDFWRATRICKGNGERHSDMSAMQYCDEFVRKTLTATFRERSTTGLKVTGLRSNSGSAADRPRLCKAGLVQPWL